jgi:hypothetical protein
MANTWFRSDAGDEDQPFYTIYNRTDLEKDQLVGGQNGAIYRNTGEMSVRRPMHFSNTTGYYTDRIEDGRGPRVNPDGQSVLFDHASSRGTPIIDSLFIDKTRGFRDLESILGVAQFDAYRKYGAAGKLGSSSDLSEHSSKLVEHAKNVGALPEYADTEVTNSHGHEDAQALNPFGTRKRQMIPESTMKKGKALAKRVLRPAKPSAPPEPMDQLEFPF